MDWIKRFILFYGNRHPDAMGKSRGRELLTYLASRANLAASTQNHALSAIVFLYKEVLGAGLRLMECVRLRVQDVDFGHSQITVRDSKGEKDRVMILLAVPSPPPLRAA